MAPVGAALEQQLQELREDRAHGGSWLARRAVEALVAEAQEADAESSRELVDRLLDVGKQLAGARPAIGAVTGAVGRVLAAAERSTHLPCEELRRLVEQEGRGLVAAKDRAARSIAIQLAPALTDALVLTHSASATVREAVLYARPALVRCTVSAPFEEGRRLFAELEGEGLEVELVEDEAAADALAESSLLLVGADTVYRDGAVCNKIGTAPLARAAAVLGVPTVVACELIKLSPVEAPPASLESSLFDVTPAEHVDEIVTEEGAIPSGDAAAMIDRTPFLQHGYALLRG